MFRRAPNRMDTIWRRPDIAPLFTCLGPPAPAVGCVALTQPGPRPKFVALQIGTGGARVGAGRMPRQAQTWLKATRTVCPRSRSRPNPSGSPTSTLLLHSKVSRFDEHEQHLCGLAAPCRPSRRQPAVLRRGEPRPALRSGAAARGADATRPGRGAGAQVVLRPARTVRCIWSPELRGRSHDDHRLVPAGVGALSGLRPTLRKQTEKADTV